MGDWWYYVTTMTFDEVNSWVKKVDDIHERRELKTWIQRELRPERLAQISEYLRFQKQHFFNAIVVGIYRGEPDWYPIKVGRNLAMPTLQPPKRSRDTFGFLYLSGEEEIFAIDGQHRVEGIRSAIKHKSSLRMDEQCMLFVAHTETDQGRARTRRLFSTLNKYARPVSKGELVALSEDDSFAIVTRRVIDEYGHLNIKFVPLTKTANIPGNNTQCITTVLGLYDLISTISLPARSRERRYLQVGPPHKSRVQEIYTLTCHFWDLLRKRVPEIKEVTGSHPEKELAAKYRKKDGGHLLFRPVGMKAFAQAARTLVDRGNTFDDAVALLSRTTLGLNSCPWAGVLWNAVARKMINKNGKLAHNLFLYMARAPLEPNDYDVLSEYQRALDDSDADLHSVRRIGPR
jgi:DNA sulfur modification protein DndB